MKIKTKSDHCKYCDTKMLKVMATSDITPIIVLYWCHECGTLCSRIKNSNTVNTYTWYYSKDTLAKDKK